MDPSAREALTPPWVEPDARYLWSEVFLDLHASRSSGMGGPSGLSYSELQAYCALRGVRLDQFELHALRAIDRAFLAVAWEREG